MYCVGCRKNYSNRQTPVECKGKTRNNRLVIQSNCPKGHLINRFVTKSDYDRITVGKCASLRRRRG